MFLSLCLALSFFTRFGGAAYNTCCQTCLNNNPYNTYAFCNGLGSKSFVCTNNQLFSTCRAPRAGEYPTLVIGYCDNCPVDAYRDLCYCTQCLTCSTGVYGNHYYMQACTQDKNTECAQCQTCGAGKYMTKECGEPDPTKDRECTGCPAGTYKNGYGSAACTTCRNCDTSLRQKRTTPCGPINDRTCEMCPVGNIVTQAGSDLDVCTPCNSGFAKASENICAACITCPQTHRINTDCMATADRTCTLCTENKMALEPNSFSCMGCRLGFVKIDLSVFKCLEAVPASGGCTIGRYFKSSYSTSTGGTFECILCQGQKENQVCANGYGVSERCNGGDKYVTCAPCAAGTARSSLMDLQNEMQACLKCSTGTYASSTGLSACVACTNKPAGISEYTAWGIAIPATSNDCPW